MNLNTKEGDVQRSLKKGDVKFYNTIVNGIKEESINLAGSSPDDTETVELLKRSRHLKNTGKAWKQEKRKRKKERLDHFHELQKQIDEMERHYVEC